MNRLDQSRDNELSLALAAAPHETETHVERTADREHAHCIFTPVHYERNYSYPLIVWLHGPDDDEHQVTRIMPHVSVRNYVAVGPRGTLASRNTAGGFGWSQTPRHIALATEHVTAAVAAARRWLNIAPDRIFIAGFGCGATMAFRVAFNLPHLFAGALAIGGEFPSTLRPLGQLHAVRSLKLFVASGRDSRSYSQERVCENLRLFHTAGLSVHLRQYPCGDDLTTNMLSDMDRWIMAEMLAPKPSAGQDRAQSSVG